MTTRRPEQRAREVLESHRVTRPPVPVERIAESEDLKLVRRPFRGNISAMLDRSGPVPVVGINSWHSTTRQRFSIAHELGHYFLHQGRKTIVDEVNYRDRRASAGSHAEEIDANKFAAELLMPAVMLERAVDRLLKTGIDPSDDSFIDELAISFEVSPQAMTYRLINLGITRQI
jgi:Zn-dependent peptidase ImmA (M78 family)